MQDCWVLHHYKHQLQVEDLPICQYDVELRSGHTGNQPVLLNLPTK